MVNFQAESTLVGNEFEDLVEAKLNQVGSVIFKDYTVPDTGVEVDFVTVEPFHGDLQMTMVEAKGGKSGGKKRPGAERTDNVKKAVANGAILKFVHPEVRYVVYFSAPPKNGSYADYMLQIAQDAGYIDEIRYL